jgi:hypothetical protein
MADYGYCQFEHCDREAVPPIVAWPEGRFRLCVMHQPWVRHRLTTERYRWRLVESSGRISFEEKIPWDPIT